MTVYETHKDDDPFASGTHKGADGASVLSDRGANFATWGVVVGVAIHNTTQETDGLVTAVTDDTVTDDTNTWDNGDSYEIYNSAAKDTVISSIATDKSRGWKVTSPDELNANGWFPEDADLGVDEDGHTLTPQPFGPHQPSRSHKYG